MKSEPKVENRRDRVEGQITNEDAGLRIREMRLLPFAYNRRNNLKEKL